MWSKCHEFKLCQRKEIKALSVPGYSFLPDRSRPCFEPSPFIPPTQLPSSLWLTDSHPFEVLFWEETETYIYSHTPTQHLIRCRDFARQRCRSPVVLRSDRLVLACAGLWMRSGLQGSEQHSSRGAQMWTLPDMSDQAESRENSPAHVRCTIIKSLKCADASRRLCCCFDWAT